METPVPHWLPDWKDENNYPDPTKTSTQEWAWEFLRRNPEYQREYEKYQALLQNLALNDADFYHLLQSPRAKGYSTPLHFLTEDPVAHTFLEITPEIINFCNLVHSQFSVRAPGGIPDPAKSYSESAPSFIMHGATKVYSPQAKKMLSIKEGMVAKRDDLFFQNSDRAWLQRNEEETLHGITKRPTEILFKIDLLFNYGEELEEIADLLRREKKQLNVLGLGKRINKQKEYDPDLLVVYDATTLGASTFELAEHLFPALLNNNRTEAISRVSKMFNDAKGLVQSGYLRLASL